MECWGQPIKGYCCLLRSQTPPTGGVGYPGKERSSGNPLPPFLRHQHSPGPEPPASQLPAGDWQRLVWEGEGPGWEAEGGIHTSLACAPVLCLPPFVICSWPPQPLSLALSLHPSPFPTHLPPHLSVSASLLTPLTTPPRHPALHASVSLSILPSVPACIGLWACESLTPCLVGDQGGGTLREGLEGGWECGVLELAWGWAGQRSALIPALLDQVILGEVFSDYTPAQVVVKELRASAGPLEQRKFISEAQPYR